MNSASCLFYYVNKGNEICLDIAHWIYFVAITGFIFSSLLGAVVFFIRNKEFAAKKVGEKGGWFLQALGLVFVGLILYCDPADMNIRPFIKALRQGTTEAFIEGWSVTSLQQKVLIFLCFGYGLLSSATFSHGEIHGEKAYDACDAVSSAIVNLISEVFKVAVYVLTFNFVGSRTVLLVIFVTMIGLFAANAYFELMYRHKYNPEFTYGSSKVKAAPKGGLIRFVSAFFGRFRHKIEASTLGLIIFLYGLVALIDEFG